MASLKIPPLRPNMLFTDKLGNLTKDAYDFLHGLFTRVGGSLSALNAVTLADKTWDSPNPIGSTTPNTGTFTTLTSTASTTTTFTIKAPRIGRATLVAGVVTVASTVVTSNSSIFVTSNVDGGTPGWLRVSAIVAGTSFTIRSSSATDTSTVSWVIVERG